MAFNPSIDYVGHQRLRAQGIEGVTKAKLWKKKDDERKAREAAARAAASKKKSSFGRKIIGAVARGAAAYYTGGASEASGVGAMMDQQIQGGSDYERNEYGDMVGAVSSMSGMMTSKTAGAASNRLNAQSARDDAMQTRMDGISVEAGLDFAQKRAAKDTKNREVFNEYKGGFLNFGKDIDGLDLDATVIDYSGIKKGNKVETTPAITYDGNTARGQTTGIMKTGGDQITTESGQSTILTQEQKDLLSGNETQVQQPAPVPASPPVVPVQQTPQLVDPNRPDDQGQSAY
jgi:predicted kinase